MKRNSLFSCYAIVAISLLLNSGCTSRRDDAGKDVLVAFGDNKLTREAVTQALPIGITGVDSLRFVDTYIQQWIHETVLFGNVHLNIDETSRIEQEVERYRRRLIIQQYEKEEWERYSATDVADSALYQYYQQYGSNYLLQGPLMKGFYFKIPIKDSNLQKVKRWLRKNDVASQAHLLEFVKKGGYLFKDYTGKWITVKEAVASLPAQVGPLDRFVRNFQFFEANKGAYCHYLFVQSYLCTGEVMPFEMVHDKIKNAYLYHQQKNFIQKLENDLYQKALEQHKIIFYNKER